jgi:hypothetical protein
MKILQLVLCLCLIDMAMAYAQAPHIKGKNEEKGRDMMSRASLQLTTEVVSQGYCSDEYDTSVILNLRLNYRNTGTVPVILYKKSSVGNRYMISHSLKEAAAQKYLEDSSGFDAIESAQIYLPEEKFFAILKPSESYSLETVFNTTVYDGSKDSEDDLRPGSYFLQLEISTWYYLASDPNEFREKWREKGFLWTRPVTSLPMPFTVEEMPPVVPCTNYFKPS